jgi:hypothetical protein
VSQRQRQRTVCQSCGNSCRVMPMELQVHEFVRPYWVWLYHLVLYCPPCKTALLSTFRRSIPRGALHR